MAFILGQIGFKETFERLKLPCPDRIGMTVLTPILNTSLDKNSYLCLASLSSILYEQSQRRMEDYFFSTGPFEVAFSF